MRGAIVSSKSGSLQSPAYSEVKTDRLKTRTARSVARTESCGRAKIETIGRYERAIHYTSFINPRAHVIQNKRQKFPVVHRSSVRSS